MNIPSSWTGNKMETCHNIFSSSFCHRSDLKFQIVMLERLCISYFLSGQGNFHISKYGINVLIVESYLKMWREKRMSLKRSAATILFRSSREIISPESIPGFSQTIFRRIFGETVCDHFKVGARKTLAQAQAQSEDADSNCHRRRRRVGIAAESMLSQ